MKKDEVILEGKRHTIKNTIVSNSPRKVIYLGKTEEGKIHDKKLAEKDGVLDNNTQIDKYGNLRT